MQSHRALGFEGLSLGFNAVLSLSLEFLTVFEQWASNFHFERSLANYIAGPEFDTVHPLSRFFWVPPVFLEHAWPLGV